MMRDTLLAACLLLAGIVKDRHAYDAADVAFCTSATATQCCQTGYSMASGTFTRTEYTGSAQTPATMDIDVRRWACVCDGCVSGPSGADGVSCADGCDYTQESALGSDVFSSAMLYYEFQVYNTSTATSSEMAGATVDKVKAIYQDGQDTRLTEVRAWKNGEWGSELGERLKATAKALAKSKAKTKTG